MTDSDPCTMYDAPLLTNRQ